MRQFMVCRKDATRPGHQIHSSLFPIIVEAPYDDAEAIVKRAFATISGDYVGKHEYIVVPMDDACLVSFTPREQYDVKITRW